METFYQFIILILIIIVCSAYLSSQCGNDLMEKLADLKSRGFDGSITGSKGSRMEEIAVWNLDKIKTKSQLTDIWNKANKK